MIGGAMLMLLVPDCWCDGPVTRGSVAENGRDIDSL